MLPLRNGPCQTAAPADSQRCYVCQIADCGISTSAVPEYCAECATSRELVRQHATPVTDPKRVLCPAGWRLLAKFLRKC